MWQTACFTFWVSSHERIQCGFDQICERLCLMWGNDSSETVWHNFLSKKIYIFMIHLTQISLHLYYFLQELNMFSLVYQTNTPVIYRKWHSTNNVRMQPKVLFRAHVQTSCDVCDAVRGFLLWTSLSEGHQGRRADQEVWCPVYLCWGELHSLGRHV